MIEVSNNVTIHFPAAAVVDSLLSTGFTINIHFSAVFHEFRHLS